MKLVFLPIAIILALEAASLFTAAYERHVFHTSIHTWTNVLGGDPNSGCFNCDEHLRYFMAAFMISSAYLLLAGEAVWPALVSQVAWLALESNLCQDKSMVNLRNFVIQLLIFYILASNTLCCGEKCKNVQNPTVEKRIQGATGEQKATK